MHIYSNLKSKERYFYFDLLALWKERKEFGKQNSGHKKRYLQYKVIKYKVKNETIKFSPLVTIGAQKKWNYAERRNLQKLHLKCRSRSHTNCLRAVYLKHNWRSSKDIKRISPQPEGDGETFVCANSRVPAIRYLCSHVRTSRRQCLSSAVGFPTVSAKYFRLRTVRIHSITVRRDSRSHGF